MIRADAYVAPSEQPILGDGRCRDVARQAVERPPHALPRLDVPPPVLAIGIAPVLLARVNGRPKERHSGQDLDHNVGTKKNSKGYKDTWVGYKLHIDVADGQIPISCLLTSAALHDSQAAIPLATLSAERTTNLYDLMDAAYDAEQIREHSRSLGHVPLIDVNPRGDKARAEGLRTEARRLKNLGFQRAEQVRYNERTAGERVNGRLKDEFGGRHVRVRGAAKVMCHCMFGMLALTADQLLRLVT